MSTSLFSTLMTYVRNVLNWPDTGGQMMDMTPKLFFFCGTKVIFLENRKTTMNKITQICLKYSLRCVRASILERDLKNNRLSPKTMLEYAWNSREYFSFINFDDICHGKHLKLA